MSRSDDCDDSLQWHSGLSKNWQQTDRYPTAVDVANVVSDGLDNGLLIQSGTNVKAWISGSSLDIEDAN